MTRYDEIPGHPLAGVPQEVLTVTRDVLLAAVHINDVDTSTDQLQLIADAVVLALRDAAYLHRTPSVDRDQLIFDLRYAHKVWVDDEIEVGDSVHDSSLYAYLADQVVLPLLRGDVPVPPSVDPGKLEVGTECAGCGRDLPLDAETFSLVRWDARRQANVLVSIHCGLCYRNGAIG